MGPAQQNCCPYHHHSEIQVHEALTTQWNNPNHQTLTLKHSHHQMAQEQHHIPYQFSALPGCAIFS
jgi:hypothetical protein